MTNSVHVASEDPKFRDPEVPQKRTFRKAKDVIKALITKANAEAANLAFTDFKVTVDADAHTITLNLKEDHVNRYVLAEPKVFTYNDVDFNAFVTSTLGFALTYSEGQLEAVKAAFPNYTSDDDAPFTFDYADDTQTLTVTVKATETEIDFTEDNATLATALFPGKSIQIKFVDDAIDIAEKLPNTELTLDLAELLEPAAGVGA